MLTRATRFPPFRGRARDDPMGSADQASLKFGPSIRGVGATDRKETAVALPKRPGSAKGSPGPGCRHRGHGRRSNSRTSASPGKSPASSRYPLTRMAAHRHAKERWLMHPDQVVERIDNLVGGLRPGSWIGSPGRRTRSMVHRQHPDSHGDHHHVLGQRDEAERDLARPAHAGALDVPLVHVDRLEHGGRPDRADE